MVHFRFDAVSLPLLLALLAGPAIGDAPADEGYSTLYAAPAVEPADQPADRGETGPPRPFVDLDEEPDTYVAEPLYTDDYIRNDWGCQFLPQGRVYGAYLAGPKESRLSTHLINIPDDSTMWDSTLGARVGLFRIGTIDPFRPTGLQLDIEGSAQLRMDLPDDKDVIGTDYRVGFPLTWGDDRRQWKFAFYHLSSHLGDEFLIKHMGFPRFFQVRDALVLGRSVYLTDALRLYAEVGWACNSVASDPWELQFGVDYAPRAPTGVRGAPFFAINGYLREELDFGGGLTIQTGWAWRSEATAHLMRIGLHYYNGASTQYAFLPFHEQQIGAGAWYDF
ncbi:MAG: DUF1207 domain-containing protein [Planctomycetes bacterium]|nr:DUF1207 domain-containing protein [Planctomycetota bacterium]MBL7041532.1 DUF1207 domain-containing protein [Pirellulaceae bacterium]